eukprot:CAMPEP_0118892354 /NCGR_PEP_ID=MMETSP1166-20130328/1987_1 /TAXON_ID=1104430 /ORGANISM="Chrysoreinhardia sp, Strain CCMP3193" /LENGTH=409 /DNA_ID=CAMNT_0006831069 /DNA_START=52 /DNA_END=1281 /DNA_ORIENTATION=-
MTKDVNAEIAALQTEIEAVEKKIKQVEAALCLDSSWSGPNPYAGRGEDFLEKELGRLRDDLTELRREKNLLLEKQQNLLREENLSGAESKKMIRVFNEWSKKVQVWTVKDQTDMHLRLGRVHMELFSVKDDAVVDDFDAVVPASPEELRDPKSFRYVARPTSQKDELQHAKAMANNAADKLEAEAGSWLQDVGLTPHFRQGFFHDKHNPHHVFLQTPRWVKEGPGGNKSGERECDLLFTLDDNSILCFGSVKTKFTDDYMRELHANIDLLKDSSANVSIKIDPGPFASRFPAAVAKVVDDLYVPIGAVLACSPTVVGLAVTGIPNTELKPRDDVVVVESRGNFSLAPHPAAKYDATRPFLEAIRSVAAQQQQSSSAAAAFATVSPRIPRSAPSVIGSRAHHSLLRRARK